MYHLIEGLQPAVGIVKISLASIFTDTSPPFQIIVKFVHGLFPSFYLYVLLLLHIYIIILLESSHVLQDELVRFALLRFPADLDLQHP